MSPRSSIHVVVVGAGLAGLAAAWRIRRHGHEVSVLERGDRTDGGGSGRFGGEWIDGFCIDHALRTVHDGDRYLLQLVSELGLREALLPLRPVQVCQTHRGIPRPIDPGRLHAVRRIPGVGLVDGLRLVRWPRLQARYSKVLDPTAPERAASLDYRSVADFARLYFGESVLAHWVEPEVVADYGGDARDISRVAALIEWVARRTGRERPVSMGLPRRGLHEIIAAALAALPIRHAVEATRIDEAPAGGFTVECRGLAGGRGSLDADAVVLATSAAEAGRLARHVVSPAERDHLASIAYAPSIDFVAALDRPPCGVPQLVRVPHDEGLPFDAVLLEPGIAGGRAPTGAGLATLRATERFTAANAAATDEVVSKGLITGLERLLPSMAGSVAFTRCFRRSAAIPRFDVGAYRALARFRSVQRDRRELARRLYFAGDHLIGPRAEHAVVSGFRAAADLAADLRDV